MDDDFKHRSVRKETMTQLAPAASIKFACQCIDLNQSQMNAVPELNQILFLSNLSGSALVSPKNARLYNEWKLGMTRLRWNAPTQINDHRMHQVATHKQSVEYLEDDINRMENELKTDDVDYDNDRIGNEIFDQSQFELILNRYIQNRMIFDDLVSAAVHRPNVKTQTVINNDDDDHDINALDQLKNPQDRFIKVSRSESVQQIFDDHFKSSSDKLRILVDPKYSCLLQEIASFMKLNANQSGEIKFDPELVINGLVYRQSEVLQIKELGSGQYAVLNIMDLHKGSVIGIYRGFECLESEHQKEEGMNDRVCFNGFILKMDGDDSVSFDPSKRIVIDCDVLKSNDFQYVHFMRESWTGKHNVDLLMSYIDNWPLILVVANCEIAAGSEMTICYRGINDGYIYGRNGAENISFWRGNGIEDVDRFSHEIRKALAVDDTVDVLEQGLYEKAMVSLQQELDDVEEQHTNELCALLVEKLGDLITAQPVLEENMCNLSKYQ